MKSLFQNARKELAAFVEQRKNLALVVCCSDNDAAFLLQLLRDLDTESGSDLFLLFGGTFNDLQSYLHDIIEAFRLELAEASREKEAQQGSLLPSLPPELLDKRRPPLDRLRSALLFAHTLLPKESGHRLIWAMVPQEIHGQNELLALVAGLANDPSDAPWMRGTRICVRHCAVSPDDLHRIDRSQVKRSRVISFDFGPQAIAAAFDHEVEDESLPLSARMEALLSSALLATAHNRFKEAGEKLAVLLGHYQSTQDLAMQAVVMNGIGDLFRRQTALDRAQHWYECAVDAAADCKIPVVLAIVIRNLGEIAYETARYSDAEFFFEGLDKLAGATLDADSKANALEWLGLSQYAQKKHGAAAVSWENAAKLSRAVFMDGRLRSNLQRLQGLYKDMGLKERLRGIDQQLRELSQGGPHA